MSIRKLLAGGLVLLIAACSGGGGSGNNNPAPQAPSQPAAPAPALSPPGVAYILDEFFPNKTFTGMRSSIHAAVSGAPRSQAMLDCAVLVTEDTLCSFNRLPLIGMETSNPTIDDIMSRVLVSHDWMASRFRQVLNEMPAEVRLITRGITAIVISHDIRPSFYWQGTGAIYLDPDRLWLTNAELRTIDTVPDFRQDLGNVFQFTMPARYVSAGEDIRTSDRDLTQISRRMAALLYHELAHANDFFPPGRLNQIDRTVPMYQAISTSFRPSTQLNGLFPLQSVLMDRLAGVSFRGESVRPQDRLLTADDVAADFPVDVASDFYSYTTEREDFAMLVEEVMMKYSYGIDRDIAVTELPATLTQCSQLVVSWGQRNRIAEPAIQTRASFAIQSILPEVADQVASLITNMVPVPMTPGKDWCDNIALASPADSRSLRQPAQSVDLLPMLVPDYL